MPAKPTRLGKQEVIDRWSALSRDHPMSVDPISYKHKGSSFDQDSIRITGSQEFIDSILARLSDLLEYDSNGTRLHVLYTQTLDRKTQELSGAWGCYVQVHERGQGRFRGGSRRARKAAPMPATEPEAIGSEDEAIEPDDEADDTSNIGTDATCDAMIETLNDDNSEEERIDHQVVEKAIRNLNPSKTEPATQSRRSKSAPRYAIATVYPDGEYDWAEPNGGIGCDTYDDEQEATDNLAGFLRTPGVNTTGLQVVKVRKNAKGKMELAK